MTIQQGFKGLSRTLDQLSRRKLLTPHFERAILAADWPTEYPIKVDNRERVWDGYFHPSSDTEPGALQLYYKFHPEHRHMVEPWRPSPQVEFAMQIGSAYHSVMQSLLIHLGFTTEEECEVKFVNEERWVSGHVDVRKIWLPDGRVIPCEIKSADYPPKTPMAKHIQQFQVYMDVGCEEPQELGIIIYIGKRFPHDLEEHVVVRDEELLNGLYDKWASVLEAIDMNDPSGLRDCCMPQTSEHFGCPAREVCRIGRPIPSGVR